MMTGMRKFLIWYYFSCSTCCTDSAGRSLCNLELSGNRIANRQSNTTIVGLSKAFTGITLVTDALAGESDGTDIALLWSNAAPTIGLWNLGRAIGSALHGVETLDIGANIATVLDVPGPDFPTSKILVSNSGDFFVLDAHDGKELYRFNTGGPMAGGIVTYQQHGKQFVAVASGNSGGSIPLQGSATIVIFGL